MDEHHDWIGIRRGLYKQCWKTITFLPLFSLPYTHYSLAARSQALQRYFVRGCSPGTDGTGGERRQPRPDVSTLRRWFRNLDSAERLDRLEALQPESSSTTRATASAVPSSPTTSFPFLRKMVSRVAERLACGGVLSHDRQILSLADGGLLPTSARTAASLLGRYKLPATTTALNLMACITRS